MRKTEIFKIKEIEKLLLSLVATFVFVTMIGLSFTYWAQTATAKEPVKIGIIAPLTGHFAAAGTRTKAGTEILAKWFNESGGISGRPISFLIRDSKGKPSEGLRQVKDLVLSEGCMFVGGGYTSGVAAGCAKYCQETGKALWTSFAAGANSIVEEDGGRYVTMMATNSTARARAMAWYALRKWGKTDKRIYVLAPNFNYPRQLFKEFKAVWNKEVPDTQLVGETWTKLGTPDFTPYISAVLAKKPDLVFTVLFGADLITFLKQAEPYRFMQKFHTISGYNSTIELFQDMRKGDEGLPIGGSYLNACPFEVLDNAKNNKYWKTMYEKYGFYPSSQSCQLYPYVDFLKAAMEKAGTTTDLEEIIDALLGLTVKDTSYGEITLRACDGQALMPEYAGTIAWDTTERFKCPIMTDYIRVEPELLYHSCDEVMEIRASAKAK